ncbi:MAG: argininosuccinate lyase [Peptococcia bacterium]
MKLWGGRFSKESSELMEDFHSSISFDQRLYRYDIQGSIAHARMLGDQGIISAEEAQKIIRGLESLIQDIEAGKIEFSKEAEDIHMNVETLLTERIGPTAKKLHTGRSRNDQVAVDTKMFVKDEIKQTQQLLVELLEVILRLSTEHNETIMPGYTHLQIAQPVTLGHHLLAYFEMFSRDWTRLRDCYNRANYSPLGAGALAGTTYPLDRHMTAVELGFAGPTENSMDSVSDRDYIIEFVFASSLIMLHLSRFCEEIILWASQEWAFIDLDDAYSTGSSIMPQKKNPDVAELVRGKTGRVYGHMLGLLTMMKGIPLAYNKDMQEDKEALFDAVDTVQKCLLIFTAMLDTTKFKKENMLQAAGKGYSNATDLADYLVSKGMSFRDAHHVVGSLVAFCLKKQIPLEQLTMEQIQEACQIIMEAAQIRINEDVFEALKLENVVARRLTYGGTAPQRVREAIARARERLEEMQKD